jgi:flagella basal body P-ring formation protein FlgA
MKRFVLSAFVLAAAIAPAFAQTSASATTGLPTLKRDVIVASDVVRIGDLVENAGSYADIAIFRAPDLGETGAVRADKVADALMRNGLYDLNRRGLLEVSVTRASRSIDVPELEARIARALSPRYNLGVVENIAVAFDREARPVRLDPRADLRVARMVYDASSRRFDLTFEISNTSADKPTYLRYTGTAFEAVDAAVLRNPVARGEVIRENDIAIERRARADLGGSAAPVNEVVGMAARRALRAGDALRMTDVAKPELVQRNENVTLVFETAGMILSLRGKAIDSGSHGDVVGVLNLQSKRTVQGIVSGPGRVTVTHAGPRIAAAESESQPRNSARRTQ